MNPRACAVGAWSLIVTGAAHAAAMAAGAATSPPPAEEAARRTMAATHVTIAGLDRTLWQLFTGFSLAMALFIAGLGALNLLALRRAPELFLRSRAAGVLNLCVVLPALALSVLLFPPPPILFLGVSCAAFGYALTRPASRTPCSDG
ncbi:LIC_13387 family protein [Actinoplanes sp. NPDC049316]|uniref:LIC_13387 family protein n=1 Tax=Actinoplanes sp. NPDC049316 TaxID=3154727 RepID=UPI003415F83D